MTTTSPLSTTITSEDGGSKVGNIHWSDVLVICIYFVIIIVVGLWSMCRKDRGTTKGYFLAGRSMPWWPVGASLFASNIGSEHFIGLAGTGAAAGIGVANFEINAILILQLLGFVFVPVYMASGVYTMPEYMRRRYGGQRIRVYLAMLSLLLYVFTKISVDLYAGGTFIQQAIGVNMYLSVISLLLITAIYTIAGGLAAVIYTDTVQAVIMICGAFVLMIMSFVEVGGYTGLEEKYFAAVPASVANSSNTCGQPREDAFHLLRSATTGDLPWPGVVLGLPMLSMWYWCTDQIIVQRTLSAKNLTHAKGGTVLAGWLKVLPLFLIVFPGMISRVLYADEVACATPETCMKYCESEVSCSNIAYPRLVIGILPDGVRGLMLAVMLSALMSSLTSIFNSASTVFTMDIWRRFRNRASERELMVVGRVFILILVGISIVWIPVVQEAHSGQLFTYIQSVTGFLTPPISVAFLLGIMWSRTNEIGAISGLMVGLLIGLTRFIMEFAYGEPKCGEEDFRPAVLKYVHFTHFTIILFVISFIVTVVVSLCTKPIAEKHLYRLTYWTRHSKEIRVDIGGSDELGPQEDEVLTNNGKEGVQPMRIDEDDKDQSKARRFYEWFCGYSTNTEEDSAAKNRRDALRKGVSIREDPKWRRFVMINCVLVLGCAIFLFGFFS